jgi:Right handed beta helix region
MTTFWLRRFGTISVLGCLLPTVLPGLQAHAQSVPPRLRVLVNSAQDGPIQPDQGLTLREAIALTNGTLSLDRLSPQEAAQVQAVDQSLEQSQIGFDLPPDQTTIYLKEALPPLRAVGLSLDGTTQPNYGKSLATEGLKPIVAIAPAPDTEILRGLTILADRVAVRGLSLYGFTQTNLKRPAIGSLLSADILVARQLPELVRSGDLPEPPLQGVILERNWIGIAPNGRAPAVASDFGISIFNGSGTLIRNNVIANHGGSGIITGINAQNTLINSNLIERNGQTGMADALRLEGDIGGTQIIANQISESGGSAIYLFKSEGAVTIQENKITANGLRLKQAALVLMGSGHQVIENTIADQSGPGVVVAAYPKSDRIIIKDNRFSKLKGLSIDLLSRQHTEVVNYLAGDGPNPTRDSDNRRLDTANGAINTPEFLSSMFYLQGDVVNLDGKADPGVTVVIYKVTEPEQDYGPLNEPIATVQTDEKGRFGLTLSGLKGGERVSAIATHPQYGTSEPALNAVILTIPDQPHH